MNIIKHKYAVTAAKSDERMILKIKFLLLNLRCLICQSSHMNNISLTKLDFLSWNFT